MAAQHGRRLFSHVIEIDTLESFDEHRARTSCLSGWFVSSLDLRDRDDALLSADPRGSMFLGCDLTEAAADHLRVGGALVFPRLPDVPFNPYRGGLYDAASLYDGVAEGHPYAQSTDGRIHAWSQQQTNPPDIRGTLATALHDHAIADALDDALAAAEASSTVGVMGGHAAHRGSAEYAAAADLGMRLARSGHTVLTGGGPGAMEAANLGAYLVNTPEALPAALEVLAKAPTFAEPTGVDAWARAALTIVDAHRETAGPSYGIPTWFYGHEPPNAFATGIAKFFSNALREDMLLSRCRGGIVYLPGRAGTVQEIFQATTAAYYSGDPATIVPIVLVGRDHWTTTLPAWPLLSTLAAGRAMARRVALVDDVSEAIDALDSTAIN